MHKGITELEMELIDRLYDMNIEYEDTCGIMAFLERSEEKQGWMLDFLLQNPNADIQDIYDQLSVILEIYDGETNVEDVIY